MDVHYLKEKVTGAEKRKKEQCIVNEIETTLILNWRFCVLGPSAGSQKKKEKF